MDKEYYDTKYSIFGTKKPFVLDVILLLWIRKNLILNQEVKLGQNGPMFKESHEKLLMVKLLLIVS